MLMRWENDFFIRVMHGACLLFDVKLVESRLDGLMRVIFCVWISFLGNTLKDIMF